MESAEPFKPLLLLQSTKSLLVIMLASSVFLQIQAFTWNKAPSNPVYGILGDNITLQWNFTMVNWTKLQHFALLQHGNEMVIYSGNEATFYFPFKGRVALTIERKGSPTFTLLKLTQDYENDYCFKVYMKGKKGLLGDIKKNCTQLKLKVRPAIESISTNQTLNETNDVILSCGASGKPPPNITWSKDGNEGNILNSSSMLVLKNITKEQGGLYWCTADNGIGKAESAVRIIVQYEPSIKLSATTYNVTEGSNVTLLCESDGYPAPTVTWSKIGGLGSIAYPPGQRLTIRNANRTEGGTYSCKAANSFGKPAVAVMHVNVLYSPRIVKGPLNQTVNETKDLRLFCNATGNPRPLITWSKGFLRIGFPSFDGLLIVKNVNKSDSGVYQCNASNGVGNDAHATAPVIINYKPRSTLLTSNTTKGKAILGQAVTFQCKADSVPPSKLELRFKDVLLGYFINGEYILEKINATNQGTYECVARNVLGLRRMATFNLTVLVPPLIDYVTNNVTVNETDNLELFCNATGNPRPEITWTFVNGHQGGDIRRSEILTLSDIKRSQAGYYQCAAFNNLTNAHTANVHVTINYKPDIKGSAIKQNTNSWIGHETKLTCEVEGIPVPEIIWIHDSSSRVAASKSFNSSVSTLTFIPESHSDFGVYVCQARNFLGMRKKVFNVEMLARPLAPKILEIEAGVNYLKIYWNASTTHPAGPVLRYVVQVKEKDDPLSLKTCPEIEAFASSFTCVLEDLKKGTVYVVQVAAQNIVGISEFTEKEIQTKDTGADENKEIGGHQKQKGKSLYTAAVDAIIGGVLGFSGLLVVIVAIVANRRPCHKGSKKNSEDKSSDQERVDGHENKGFVENPKTDESEDQV